MGFPGEPSEEQGGADAAQFDSLFLFGQPVVLWIFKWGHFEEILLLHISPIVLLEIFEGFSGVELYNCFGAGFILICFNHLYFFDSKIFKDDLHVFFGNLRW